MGGSSYDYDDRRLKQAKNEGKIYGPIYSKIMSKKGLLLREAETVARSAELTTYPPLILEPEAVVDRRYNLVIGAYVDMIDDGQVAYLAVKVSGPYLAFASRELVRGVLAHELGHFIKNTIEAYSNQGKEGFVFNVAEGVDVNRLDIEERHELFFEDPIRWFKTSLVIDAFKYAESFSKKPRKISDQVLKLASEAKILLFNYERGRVTNLMGSFSFGRAGDSVVEKAIANGWIARLGENPGQTEPQEH
jgi:hypothetical protein